MQENYTPFTVDPRHLNLRDFPLPNATTSQTSTVLYDDRDEDLTIANGQVDFDDGDGDQSTSVWSPSNGQKDTIADLDLDGGFNFSSSQARSAPTRARGDGGFSSDLLIGEEGSSPVVDPGPWNHLKFAVSVSGPDQTSSREDQTEDTPQWPSNLVVPGTHRPTTYAPRRRRQTFADNRSMHYGPTSAPNPNIQTVPLTYQGTALYTTPPLSYQQLRQRDSNWRPQSKARSSASSTSLSIPFPDLEIDNTPAQSLCSHTTVTRYHEQPSGGTQRKDGWTSDTMKEDMDEMSQDLIRESRPQSRSDDPDILAPSGHSWQQQHSLHSVGNQFLDSVQTSHRLFPDHVEHRHLVRPTNDPYGSTYDAATAEYQYKDESRQLDHPDAIVIPTSSQRYQSDRPSSFPITAGFFPTGASPSRVNRAHQTTQKARRRRDTISTPNTFSIPMQRKGSNKSGRASRSGSLTVIREDGKKSSNLSPRGSLKGRRGPLSEEARSDAKQKRLEKTVCVRCHMMKLKCEGEDPCEGCRKSLNAKSWGHPCTKSYFLAMVECETCNAVFQRSFSHLALDGNRRVKINLPSTFDVKEMLSRLEAYQSRYNIRVRPWTGSPYTLNLALSFTVLSKFYESKGLQPYGLHNFIESKAVTASEWLECLTDYDQNLNVLDRSIRWNDMPSRNSYDLVTLDNSESTRPLDVGSRKDLQDIVFSAQLCRIILRALELEAFTALQKAINDLPKQKDETVVKLLSDQLGQLLLSLRWRIAWWNTFGNWTEGPEAFKRNFTNRVMQLTYVFYCYYFIARKKISAGTSPSPTRDPSRPQPFSGDLPDDDSPRGFNAWMQRGQDLIGQAMVPQQLAGSGF